jgi:hypothetical protein
VSFDLYVLVPQASWPTARQLNDALAAQGLPTRLGERDDDQWDKPLAPVVGDSSYFTVETAEHAKLIGQPTGTRIPIPNEAAMPLILEGRKLDPDFGMTTLDDPAETNRDLVRLGSDVRAHAGDHLVWFSHHADQWNWNASMDVLATFIRAFDGYGFEFQGLSHGRESFASELLQSLYENPQENPLAAD